MLAFCQRAALAKAEGLDGLAGFREHEPDFAGNGDHLPAFLAAALGLSGGGDMNSGGNAVGFRTVEYLLHRGIEVRKFAIERRCHQFATRVL